MVMEFQLTRQKLETLLRNRLLAARPCEVKPFAFSGDTYYLARITFGGSSIFTDAGTRTVPLYHLVPVLVGNGSGSGSDVEHVSHMVIEAPPLRMNQSLILHMVSDTALEQSNANPPPTLDVPVDLTLDLAITFNDAGDPFLCVTLHEVTGIGTGDRTVHAKLSKLVASAVRTCRHIDLSALDSMLKTELPRMVNAGIALHANGQRVAIRLDTEPDRPNVATFWSDFYAGSFDELGAGHDWAVLVPPQMILQSMANQMNASLAKAKSDGRFALDSGPDAAWTPSTAGPAATISASGEIIDACIGIDVDVDLTLAIGFSVPSPGVLRVTATIAWDSNDAELFLCEFVTASVWPIVGAVMLAQNTLEWTHYLGGMVVGPVIIGFVMIGYLSSDEPASHIPSISGWVEVSDTHRYQDLAFPSTLGGLVGGLTLTAVSARVTGLVLAGDVSPVEAKLLELTAKVTPFGPWILQNPCSQPRYETKARIALGPWTLPNGPSVPVRVCDWEILDDPLEQYADFRRPTQLDLEFRVRLPLKTGFYYPGDFQVEGMPYPLKVRILTKEGARLITIPPPPPPPAPIEDPLEQAALELWQAVHCTKYDSIWDQIHQLNPEWLVDPPPEADVAQSWAVTITGMAPRDAFLLRDTAGAELVTAFADPRGVARATATLDHLQVGGISIVGADVAGPVGTSAPQPRTSPTGARSGQSVLVKQTLLVHVATIALDARLIRLSLLSFGGTPNVFVATEAAIAAYDLADPARPQRTSLHAARSGGTRLPAWAARRLAKRMRHCDGGPVRDATRQGAREYLVNRNSVVVVDEHDCRIREVDVPGADSIARAGDLIVVGSPDRLTVLADDAGQPGAPPEITAVPGCLGVAQAKVPHARRAVFVRTHGGGGSVLDLRDPGQPFELAHYARQPWYVDGEQLGGLLIRTAPDGHQVFVYRVAESITGFERPPTHEELHESRT